MCRSLWLGMALMLSVTRLQNSAVSAATATAAMVPATVPATCYLFAYFVGNGEDGLHLAWSRDAYHWQVLNGGQSYLKPSLGAEPTLMRDPCLLLGPDHTFRLVWTTSWQRHDIGYAESKDLLHWSAQQALPVMAREAGARNCWAPEVVWDVARQHYLIFWSTTILGRFPTTDGTGDADYNHRIYATTTPDFKSFTPTRLFFDAGFNVIDATLLQANNRTYLIVKDETLKPVQKNLRLATGPSPEGPFTDLTPPFTRSWVEGPTALRVGENYIIYYDCYTEGHYGAVSSPDLKHWTDITAQLAFPAGARHGTVLQVPGSIVAQLLEH